MKPRKMKDSGIPWIGEIPEGWTVRKLRFLGRLDSNGVDKKIREGEPQFKSVHYMDVYKNALNEIGDSDNYLVVSAREEKAEACALNQGDVLFTNSSETPDDIGHSTVVRQDLDRTLFGYHLTRFRSYEKMALRFEKYLFGSQYLKSWFASRATGITRYSITYQDFAEALLPIPTSQEQERIAAYLDEKCGEIDRVIAAKERQNELLRDQRAAVIHEAVTKGLNPKVKFKESGVEWIGKIPADWTLDKIKWLGKSIIGLTYSPEEVASDGTLVLRASNIQGGQVVYDDNVYVRKEIPDDIILRKDDILICSRNGSRALIGKCALIDEKAAGQTFGAFMTVLRSPANRYLFHVLNSQLFSFYLSAFLTSTINQLTTENLNNMVVPMPKTPAEQQQIAAHLDARCGEIDRVMAANEGMVAKLKEYRSSLIWEAVTGKVAV